MVQGPSVAPIRHVGLDFVTGLEAALQMRSLVNMYAHFVASHIMHRIQLSLNLQQVPFDNLEPLRMRRWRFRYY